MTELDPEQSSPSRVFRCGLYDGSLEPFSMTKNLHLVNEIGSDAVRARDIHTGDKSDGSIQ